MEYRYLGIVLEKKDIGETDRIYTIYTLEGGKIRSVAKGTRKPQSKLAASLENITLADITIVKTKGLGKITGSIVENSFLNIKNDCDALLNVFDSIKIFNKIVDFEDEEKEIFEIFLEYLISVEKAALLNKKEAYGLIKIGFLVKLLDILGYAIETKKCVYCGEKLLSEKNYFSSSCGGTICKNCLSADKKINAFNIDVNVVKLIRIFLSNKISSLLKIKVTNNDYNSAKRIVEDFLRWNM